MNHALTRTRAHISSLIALARTSYHQLYEVMCYWDVDQPEWKVVEREFVVASRTVASVGPNATLLRPARVGAREAGSSADFLAH